MSTAKVPTGRMVTDPGSAYPDVDQIAAQIRQAADGRDPVLLHAALAALRAQLHAALAALRTAESDRT